MPQWVKLVWVQSAGSAIGLIRRDHGHVYGGVLLDHDLAQRAMTADDESLSGTDVALTLIEHFSIDIPILIHSTNQVQVPWVARQLEDKGFWVTRIPYYDMTESTFLAWLEEGREIWDEIQEILLPKSDRHRTCLWTRPYGIYPRERPLHPAF